MLRHSVFRESCSEGKVQEETIWSDERLSESMKQVWAQREVNLSPISMVLRRISHGLIICDK